MGANREQRRNLAKDKMALVNFVLDLQRQINDARDAYNGLVRELAAKGIVEITTRSGLVQLPPGVALPKDIRG